MKQLSIIISSVLFLTSCMRIPSDLMKPNAETFKIRESQSHTFNAKSDKQLMLASISVLQDMGYEIKESSVEYGVLTAVKEASAVSTGQVVGAVAMAIICGATIPTDKTQYISVTMVVLNKSEDNKAVARTTFQRVIIRTDDSYYTEIVTNQNVYQEFYEKLDKALFLEVNNI